MKQRKAKQLTYVQYSADSEWIIGARSFRNNINFDATNDLISSGKNLTNLR